METENSLVLERLEVDFKSLNFRLNFIIKKGYEKDVGNKEKVISEKVATLFLSDLTKILETMYDSTITWPPGFKDWKKIYFSDFKYETLNSEEYLKDFAKDLKAIEENEYLEEFFKIYIFEILDKKPAGDLVEGVNIYKAYAGKDSDIYTKNLVKLLGMSFK